MRPIVTGVIAGVLATTTLSGGAMAQNPYADDMACPFSSVFARQPTAEVRVSMMAPR